MMGWGDGGMMGGGGSGLFWVLMVLFWIALLAVIVVALIKLLPSGSKDDRPPQVYGGVQETPEQALDRMFAVGEIDEQTYRARRAALMEMRRQP